VLTQGARTLAVAALPLVSILIALTYGSPALADESSDAAISAGIASLFGLIWLFVLLLVLGLQALKIWIFWQILTKAGFNSALAFLGLIPAGSLAIILILAFGHWPIEDELARVRSGGAAPLSTV
jgi:hypothetical protein